MTKYKLIKEYPGSPELGTIAERISKIKSNTSYYYGEGEKKYCIYDNHVEDNPEYWKKVNDNLWWVVFTKEDTIFESYYPYCLETSIFKAQDSRQYFKTKEEAEDYILYNKPCLCLNNIRYLLDKEQRSTVELLIKLKL
jgi:hypothetical protein